MEGPSRRTAHGVSTFLVITKRPPTHRADSTASDQRHISLTVAHIKTLQSPHRGGQVTSMSISPSTTGPAAQPPSGFEALPSHLALSSSSNRRTSRCDQTRSTRSLAKMAPGSPHLSRSSLACTSATQENSSSRARRSTLSRPPKRPPVLDAVDHQLDHQARPPGSNRRDGEWDTALIERLELPRRIFPELAGPVEATAIGNVLIQARTQGLVIGDLESLRALVARAFTPRRYAPR